MFSCIFRFMCKSSHPCILISSGSCVLACIFASSHPHTFGFMCACSHLHILASHTLRFICASWHPCILTSLYPEVHLCLLASVHPHILIYSGARAFGCILISSHPHILMSYSQVCVCLLVSSHPHISYPQVHACLLVSLHPHILRFMCVSFYPCILSSSYAQIRVCLHPSILISSGP